MKPLTSSLGKWWTVVLFALAMAWMESATVLYLRTLLGRLEPYQNNPLPPGHGLEWTELARELATMIMLLTVGALAGRKWINKLGFVAIAFGVWDIFYYAFLKVMCGWPHSLLDWDVLFLIPLPWWGPVLAPMCISLVMICWGTLVNTRKMENIGLTPSRKAMATAMAGIALALYVFMRDALRVADQGSEAVRHVLPTVFHWPAFLLALLAMAVPSLELCLRAWPRTPRLTEAARSRPQAIGIQLASDPPQSPHRE
jgi:hypothetical protein